MNGVINRTAIEDGIIHSYQSPVDGFLTNSHIVETEHTLVIVDGQLFVEYASEVADYVDGLGKPVDRIMLTHAHIDHWFGFEVLSARFPDVPIFALEEDQKEIRTNGQATIDTQREIYGDRVPSTVVVPDQQFTAGEDTIDGLRYRFDKYRNAEAVVQATISLPNSGVVIVGDLVYPNELYLFVVVPYFDRWMEILDDFKERASYNRILGGHGNPTDQSVLDGNIQFLRDAKEIYEHTDDEDVYTKQLKGKYPNREPENWVDLSSKILYETG